VTNMSNAVCFRQKAIHVMAVLRRTPLIYVQ
jgi:hypothetical protein